MHETLYRGADGGRVRRRVGPLGFAGLLALAGLLAALFAAAVPAGAATRHQARHLAGAGRHHPRRPVGPRRHHASRPSSPLEHRSAAATPKIVCSGDPSVIRTIVYDPNRPDLNGIYAVPTGHPKGMVVFAHGHGHSVQSWRWVLQHVATQDGYIAVAMEYPGSQIPSPLPPPPNDTEIGWRVGEGATHSIQAAQLFERTCHGLGTIVDYGVSMGGNTSGLMAMAHAKRHDGRPLFDLWFDIEGVTDLTEEYLDARGVAQSGNSTAALAVKEIEAEAGGPIEQNPAAYERLTVVDHPQDIASSGIRGVVMVHSIDDGLVGTDQTQQMASRLQQVGVPAEVYTVGTTGPKSEPGTTLDSYIPISHPEPLAGHGYEGSKTQIVIQTGLAHLDAILQRREAWPSGFSEHLVDGTVGQVF